MSKLAFKGTNETWYPNNVPELEAFLAQLVQPLPLISASRAKGIRKNLAYSLQYLEFLDRCSRDLKLSSVLEGQNYKAFIVTGCAIIEAIFYFLLVKNERAAKSEWESAQKVPSHEFSRGTHRYKIHNEIFRKLSAPKLVEMTFDAMCKKVEKTRLVELGNEVYKRIPYLRNLRNRVHIYGIENALDTDYLKLGKADFQKMKSTLKALLSSSLFPLQPPDGFDTLNFSFLEAD
jgi:hypothetical protein